MKNLPGSAKYRDNSLPAYLTPYLKPRMPHKGWKDLRQPDTCKSDGRPLSDDPPRSAHRLESRALRLGAQCQTRKIRFARLNPNYDHFTPSRTRYRKHCQQCDDNNQRDSLTN